MIHTSFLCARRIIRKTTRLSKTALEDCNRLRTLLLAFSFQKRNITHKSPQLIKSLQKTRYLKMTGNGSISILKLLDVNKHNNQQRQEGEEDGGEEGGGNPFLFQPALQL